jgi:ABC-type sulfate/molybdate transport systems ATPase subunit
MYVRLAFAVAAYLESEILIVDEVLAVGDAEFQKKCLGKMGDITAKDGRTVLFVSHNLAAVKNLCNRGILLENGLVKYNGKIDQVLNTYSNAVFIDGNHKDFDEYTIRSGNKSIQFLSVSLFNQFGNSSEQFSIGDSITIKFAIEILGEEKKSEFGVQIFDSNEMPIFHMMPRDSNFELIHASEKETYQLCLKDIRLFPGIYNVSLISANTTGHEIFDLIENAISFEIIDGGNYTSRILPRSAGLIFMNPEWKKISV